MIYRALFFFISSVVFCTFSMSQVEQTEAIKVSLKMQTDSLLYGNIFLHLNQLDIDRAIEFIVPKSITNYKISYVNMNKEQEVFKRFLAQEMTPTDSIRYSLQELAVYKKRYNRPLNSLIYLLVAFKDGKKIIITDTNNNFDFREEEVDTFDISSLTSLNGVKKEDNSTAPKKVITYEYYDIQRREILERQCKVQVIGYAYGKELISTAMYENFDVTLKTDEGRVGEFAIENENYRIYLRPFLSLDDFRYVNVRVFKLQDSLLEIRDKHNPFFREKDFISLQNQEYQLFSSSIFGEEVILKPVSNKEKNYGDKPKQYSHPIEMNTVFKNEFKLRDYEGQYVLLDFWGTWCQPCIEQLPLLRDLSKAYLELNIVSIALMGKEETEADLIDVIKIEDLDWTHIADYSRAIETSPIMKFRISSYPSYILIGPDQKIIYRNVASKQSFSKLSTLLKKIYGK